MFCKHCRYVLDYVTARRCPECGHAFDPLDPRTYWTNIGWRSWLSWRRRLVLVCASAAVAIGAVTLVFNDLSDPPYWLGRAVLLFNAPWLWLAWAINLDNSFVYYLLGPLINYLLYGALIAIPRRNSARLVFVGLIVTAHLGFYIWVEVYVRHLIIVPP